MSTVTNVPERKGLITAAQMQQVIELDETIRQTNKEVIEAEKSGNEMLKAMTMAQGMNALRKGLTPLMPMAMELMGTPMGFRTDKDRDPPNKQYTTEEVRDVLIVGLLRGFRVVGNEINIIAGNFYPTKEGMKRFVMSFPGLSNFRIQFSVPQTREGGALVPALVTWTLNGKKESLDCRVTKRGDMEDDLRIPVRVNSGMGVDAILGKAESKIYRRVYQILTGADLNTVDDSDSIDAGSDATTVSELSDADTIEPSSSNTVDDRQTQTVELDLDEVYRQYVDDVNNAETIDDSIAVRHKFFESNLYKWTADHRSKSLRVLEKRQEAIREECGKRAAKDAASAKTKSQKQLVGG